MTIHRRLLLAAGAPAGAEGMAVAARWSRRPGASASSASRAPRSSSGSVPDNRETAMDPTMHVCLRNTITDRPLRDAPMAGARRHQDVLAGCGRVAGCAVPARAMLNRLRQGATPPRA